MLQALTERIGSNNESLIVHSHVVAEVTVVPHG